MSLIDDVKRDRENGTPGPWGIVYYDAGDKDEWINCPLIEGPEDAVVVHWDGFKQRFWESAHGDQRAIDGNARRIARVPDLEAALLAAEELAEAFETALGELDEYNIALSRENYNCPSHNAALAAYREATK